MVVSNGSYNSVRPDIVVMPITSQLRPTSGLAEFRLAQWEAAGLLKPSVVKPVFATLEQALIIRRLGVLHTADQTTIREMIGNTLG